MNIIKAITFLLCSTLLVGQTTPIRNPQIQGASGSIVSGATLTNSGTFTNSGTLNGAGTFNFGSGTVTLPASSVTSGNITDGAIVNADINASAAIDISKLASSAITIAGTSTSLGGSITASAILDSISSTQGTILYRGASGWAALSPGTSGHFLKTQGAGADPAWATANGISGLTSTRVPFSTGATTLGDDADLTFATDTLSGTALKINVTATTASTSSTTGALIVAGGVGINKDSWINGLRVGRGGGNIDSNTALGEGAMAATASGINNVAIGENALNALLGGNRNTMIGHESGTDVTSGSENAGAGNQTLIALTTGNYNSGFGAGSLSGVTTASSNTALGYYAGAYRDAGLSITLVNPSNSIYIGDNAIGSADSETNAIVIGSAAIGGGSNTTVIGNSSTTQAHLFGTLLTDASTTSRAGFRIPHGVTPSSPVNGDMWTTSAGGLYVRINGSTVGPLGTGGGGGASTFATLTDVDLNTLTSGDFLKWNGTDWINLTPSDARTALGLGNAAVATTTTGGNGATDSGKIPALSSLGGFTFGKITEDVGSGSMVAMSATNGFTLAVTNRGGFAIDASPDPGYAASGVQCHLGTAGLFGFLVDGTGALTTSVAFAAYTSGQVLSAADATTAEHVAIFGDGRILLKDSTSGFTMTFAAPTAASNLALAWPTAAGTLLTTGSSLNGSNIGSGTVADARLSANVSLLGSSIALASEVTGTLPVANGGTGATALTNLIALTTDTTGNYVADVAGTSNEITSTHTPGEGSTATLSLPATIDLGGKTSFEIPNGAAPTVDAFGEIAGDNDLWAASRGAPVFFDGTAATALVNVLVSDTPSNGQYPMWNTGGTITWETPAGAGTVTATGGNLTANSIVLGAGTTDTKVLAGFTTDGTSKLNLGVAGASTGKIDLSGSTSGTVTVQPAAAAGTWTLTLPATAGTNNYVLTTNGSGATSWSAASGGISGLGSVDNVLVRTDGTAGTAAQGSPFVISDETTYSSQYYGQISLANGAQTNVHMILTPKGTGSIIGYAPPDGTTTGGNNRGTYSLDLQGPCRNSAADVASGTSSVIISGRYNKASGDYTFAGGYFNTVTGYAAFGYGYQQTASGNYTGALSGYQNTASGTASVVPGGQLNTASADYSSSIGYYANATRYGQRSAASGVFAALGDAQAVDVTLRCKTTTNSAVEMGLDGSTTYLTIPSGKVVSLTVQVTGVKSDGSAVAHYIRQYSAKNVGGTSSEVYAEVTIGTDNAAGTSLDISTVDAGDYISIKPTGVSAEVWRWVARVEAVEVAYGN